VEYAVAEHRLVLHRAGQIHFGALKFLYRRWLQDNQRMAGSDTQLDTEAGRHVPVTAQAVELRLIRISPGTWIRWVLGPCGCRTPGVHFGTSDRIGWTRSKATHWQVIANASLSRVRQRRAAVSRFGFREAAIENFKKL